MGWKHHKPIKFPTKGHGSSCSKRHLFPERFRLAAFSVVFSVENLISLSLQSLELEAYYSPRMFCAGVEGANVCSGDSGLWLKKLIFSSNFCFFRHFQAVDFLWKLEGFGLCVALSHRELFTPDTLAAIPMDMRFTPNWLISLTGLEKVLSEIKFATSRESKCLLTKLLLKNKAIDNKDKQL